MGKISFYKGSESKIKQHQKNVNDNNILYMANDNSHKIWIGSTLLATSEEGQLEWGGKNHVGEFGPLDAALVPSLGANRFAFIKPEGVTVEYSRDAGKTWQTYSLNDSQKIGLFNENGTALYIGADSTVEKEKSNYLVRVNVDTLAGSIYTELKKFVIYCSTNGSNGSYCTIEGKLLKDVKAGNDIWATLVNKQAISGWSGYNIINVNFCTAGWTDYQYQKIRFTFGVLSNTTANKSQGLCISNILGYGGVGWSTPSNLAKRGTIYTYDNYQNTTFPAAVTATSFNGKLNWSNITSKPASFTPSSHKHPWSEVTNAPVTATRWPSWSEVTDKPASFTPSSHKHPWSEVTSAPATATRWPSWGEVTDKPTKFDILNSKDNRSVKQTPAIDCGLYADFKSKSTGEIPGEYANTYTGVLTYKPYGGAEDTSGGYPHQLAFTDKGDLLHRMGKSNTEWYTYNRILDSGNSSVSKSGETLTVKINGVTQSLTNTNTHWDSSIKAVGNRIEHWENGSRDSYITLSDDSTYLSYSTQNTSEIKLSLNYNALREQIKQDLLTIHDLT